MPGAKRTGIQVYEIRSPVITDTAALQSSSARRQLRTISAGHAHIDGATLHVQTTLRDAAAAFVKPFVGLGRSIA